MRSAKLFLIVFSILSGNVFSLTNDELFKAGNDAYAKGDYVKSIESYVAILETGNVSFELYYNLGNAYFKNNDLGKAILNYERAKKIKPEDEDLKYNLKYANQRTEDKIDKAPEMFLSQWKKGVVDIMSETTWSILTIVLFILFLSLLFLFFVSGKKAFKQIGFFGAAVVLVVTLFSFYFSRVSYTLSTQQSQAIIVSPSVPVLSAPSEKASKLFQLHEGTKVDVLQQQENEWLEIKIANGNTGWLKFTTIEKI